MRPWVQHVTQATMKQAAQFLLRGWSQKDIAAACGVSPGTMRRYLRLYELHGLEVFARD